MNIIRKEKIFFGELEAFESKLLDDMNDRFGVRFFACYPNVDATGKPRDSMTSESILPRR
ncbi:MAG TPA: hypothetical protein VL633_03865 [Bacteroidota bacterium]|nr:hypothetical protein [Bacteroidota bacterium]